jgi:hypothetical protein
VSKPVLCDRVFQRARDVRLPHQIVEGLGTIFSGENLVTHAINLNASAASRKRKIELLTTNGHELARIWQIRISGFLIERWTLGVERWTFLHGL